MKRLGNLGVVTFAFLLSVLLSATTVFATQPIQLVSSTEGIGGYFDMTLLPSGVFKIDFLSIQELTGDIEGIFYNPGFGIYNPRSGVWFLEGVGTVEGVVHLPSGDLYGTFTMENWAMWKDDGSIDINYAAIVDGTGELANMRGTCFVDWLVWPPVIRWSIHFDP